MWISIDWIPPPRIQTKDKSRQNDGYSYKANYGLPVNDSWTSSRRSSNTSQEYYGDYFFWGICSNCQLRKEAKEAERKRKESKENKTDVKSKENKEDAESEKNKENRKDEENKEDKEGNEWENFNPTNRFHIVFYKF